MKRRKRQAALRRLCVGLAVVLLVCIVAIFVLPAMLNKPDKNPKPDPVVKEFTLEAGTELKV